MRRVLHRVLRKPFFGRFEVPWVWPASEDATAWERVVFPNRVGARLHGAWGAARGHDANDARGTLVLAHPMGKAAKGFWLRNGHAALFRDAGFNVLLVDANGFGESEAASFDYPDDFLTAGVWAQARAPQTRVGLVGASFGAGWGLCAMAREGSPYRAAVLEAAFPTLPEFWHHYPVAHVALRLSQVVWPSLERTLRPERDATRVIGSPDVLLIHSAGDIYTPPAFGERLRDAFCTVTTAELIVVPGDEHTFALRDARETYVGRVLPFLERALKPSA